jgi:predicted N-acyltransferase
MDRNPNFSCRVSNDLKDFDFFYNEMHVPHIQKRFGDLSELDPYDEMKDSFLKGLLLLIEEGDKSVAGGLCVIQNDTLFMRRGGVLHGNEEYLKRGASAAGYYFTLKYALAHGISKVDLLRSRPFLNDGVYRMKREWGATVYPNDESGSWVFFFVPQYSPKVANFFEINPLIVHKENRLYGLVGWGDEDPLSKKDEKQLNDKYYSPGLNGLILIQPHSENLTRFLPNETYR